MGKVLKKLTALLLCVMMIVPFMSFEISASTEKFKEYIVNDKGHSIDTYQYLETKSIRAYPKRLNIYEHNNSIVIVDAEDEILVTTYTKSFNKFSEKKISFELPLFGGFFSGKNYNFIVFGQENPEEDLEKEVFRIVKYDKQFNRIDSCSVFGNRCNTVTPFDGGTVSFAECNNELTIHTARVCFTSDDGKNHQMQFTIVLDIESMTPTNKLPKIYKFDPYGFTKQQDNHVSHSFNQLVQYDNGKRVLVDHGDGAPRSIYLQRYEYKDLYSYGETLSEKYQRVSLFKIPGNYGENYTGISLGNFQVSKNNYIVSFNSINFDDSEREIDTREAWLVICNKNFETEKNIKTICLTDYIDNQKHASQPYLVKISEKLFAVLWEEYLISQKASDNGYYYNEYVPNGIKYVIVDENGNKVTEINETNLNSRFDDCQPILVDKQIIWYYNTSNGKRHIFSLDLSNEINNILSHHHNIVEVTEKQATCTEQGNETYYECESCGFCFDDYNQSILTTPEANAIPFADHQGKASACNRRAKCDKCGLFYGEVVEHAPFEEEIVIAATCTTSGKAHVKCECEQTIETVLIPATGHTPGEWEVVTASTCTTAGKKVQKCTGCGEIVDEEIIPTSEHTAGEWQYAMYPTCSQEGYEKRMCTVCGEQIDYRTVPTLPHTPGEWVVVEEAKCGVDGKKVINCTVCGVEIESEIIDAPEHVESDWITVREPTCSKEGIKQKRCTVCLEYISDRYEKIDKLPHNPASYWTNVSTATCTEDGLKIKKCTVCGGTAEEMVIEANGHTSGDWKTIVSPTCDGAGVKIKTCTVCGEESQRIEINPTGHTPSSEWTVRKLATCTEDGEMYKKCIACGMDAETKTVDALGHNLDSEWVIEQNATCTEDGTKTQTCTRCDHSVSETIPATGHTETGWLITASADCVNSGTKIKKCTVCGVQTDSASISAKGHTVGEWEILENSTCSREGTRVKRCSDCGTVTKSEAIPRSGHEKGNWIITETPTEGSYGVKARFCIGCGMKMEEKIIYSVSNVVVKDDATGIEVVYPDGTFTGTMTVSTRNLPGSEIGSKVYAKLGECNFKGYEVKFYENGIQVNPSNTYSVRIPVPYSFNKNSAEVYGISMTTGELYKVNASYENGYFLIENADTIQYVITEKIITVSLSQTHLDMKKGDTVQLYAYTNGQGVTFTSSNPSVVTVDFYGNITAVGNGSAVITATVNGTTVQEECTVEVTQSFFDMIITAITEAFSEFFKFFTDIFKSINGSLS